MANKEPSRDMIINVIVRLILVVVIMATAVWAAASMGGPVVHKVMHPFRTVIELLRGKPDAPPKPLEEAVPYDQLKCLGYGMLANMEGAATQRRIDKERIICTMRKRAEADGSDICSVFRRQAELVAPGWGRRKTTQFFLTINVPDRAFWYIERTFSESARNEALLLAKESRCDGWEAIALKRPNRGKTMGNQKPDELAAIDATMVPAIPKSPEDEFQYFKPKPKPE